MASDPRVDRIPSSPNAGPDEIAVAVYDRLGGGHLSLSGEEEVEFVRDRLTEVLEDGR